MPSTRCHVIVEAECVGGAGMGERENGGYRLVSNWGFPIGGIYIFKLPLVIFCVAHTSNV